MVNDFFLMFIVIFALRRSSWSQIIAEHFHSIIIFDHLCEER